MTPTPDIIDFAKKCVALHTVPIRQVELARALLIAYEALEVIASEKTCLALVCKCGGSNDKQGKQRVAEQALSRIRSLSSK
jgi:hypothetical protein